MADRDGLENRCTGNRTEGSNPSLSASKEPQSIAALFRLYKTARRILFAISAHRCLGRIEKEIYFTMIFTMFVPSSVVTRQT